MKCKKCGSYAINPTAHGREPGIDLDLCDVCYWRARADVSATYSKCEHHFLEGGSDSSGRSRCVKCGKSFES